MDVREVLDDLVSALLVPGSWRYWAERILEPESQVAIAILARLALEMSNQDLYAYLIGQPPDAAASESERRQARRRASDRTERRRERGRDQ